jgi:hypothetical protein
MMYIVYNVRSMYAHALRLEIEDRDENEDEESVDNLVGERWTSLVVH